MLIEDNGKYLTVSFMLKSPEDTTELWYLSEVCLLMQDLAQQYENSGTNGQLLLRNCGSRISGKPRH